MKKSRLLTLLCLVCVVAMLMPLTVSAAQTTGWQVQDGSWYYYQDDGTMATGKVLEIGGKYYGFDYDGTMYTDKEFWSNYNGEWGNFRAKATGELYANCWYAEANEWNDSGYDWYYYGEGGKAASGATVIGGIKYVFYGDGRMATDTYYSDSEAKIVYLVGSNGVVTAELVEGWNEVNGDWYFVLNEDGGIHPCNSGVYQLGDAYFYFDSDSKMAADGIYQFGSYDDGAWHQTMVIADANGKLATNQWIRSFGSWYYLGEEGKSLSGLQTIDGLEYYFSYDGTMAVDQVVTTRDKGCYYAYGNGVAAKLEDGWNWVNGSWRYVSEDGACSDGFATIDGSKYYFDASGAMMDDTERYLSGYIRAHAGGKLFVNEWHYDGIGWQYYGSDGMRYNEGFRTIDGVPYYFEDGHAVTNCTKVYFDELYVFDAGGKGEKVTGTQWYRNEDRDAWQFVEDGRIVYNGTVTSGDYDYLFNNSVLVEGGYAYVGDVCLLADEEGRVITTPGWHIVNGEYYFVNANGALHEGWLSDTYYMSPEMEHDTVETIDNAMYVFGSNGVAEKVESDGLQNTRYGSLLYVENGKLVKDGWRYVNGAWYYFGYAGNASVNGIYNIDGSYYLFRRDGAMESSGWKYTSDGDCCYVQESGKLATGVQVIGGTQYYFSSSGRLETGFVVFKQDAEWLVVSGGKVVDSFSDDGWHQVGSDWYFVQDGRLLTNTVTELSNGKTYAFDGNGRMLTNTMYWSRYFGADGTMQVGWINMGDYWMYASNYGWLHSDGVYYIDGVQYFFDGYRTASGMQTDGEFYYECAADGRVVGTYLADGEMFCKGEDVYYFPNGNTNYTGWNGDYYFEGSRMVTGNMDLEGERYFFMPDGKLLHGFYKTWESEDGEHSNWIYGCEDGTLAKDEWVLVNGTFYYFNSWYDMISDCVYTIDGIEYEFDKNGAYIGVYEEEEASTPTTDGWVYQDGKWYYAYCDEYVTGPRYLGGKWYVFDYTGAMRTNTVDYSARYPYYYDSTGARAEYVGWVVIGGEWYYFNTDHSVSNDLFQVGDKLYYAVSEYDKETKTTHMELFTGAMTIYDKLFVFDSTGASTGAVADVDGWYYADGNWYFFQNGTMVRGKIITIGSTTYGFNDEGEMVTNEYMNGEYNDYYSYYYFGADGAMITTEGWNYTADGWIYVHNARPVYSGIVEIGGVYNVFDKGIWIGTTTITLS